MIEAAHNPEVAGSNPAPATERPRNRGLSFEGSAQGSAGFAGLENPSYVAGLLAVPP
jgi:hypothetical protein